LDDEESSPGSQKNFNIQEAVNHGIGAIWGNLATQANTRH
jgi:hypothetical protein